jgi:hypothetical protein
MIGPGYAGVGQTANNAVLRFFSLTMCGPLKDQVARQYPGQIDIEDSNLRAETRILP